MANDTEQVLFHVAANLFKGIEAVGGKLKVTNQKLLFEAHAFNIQAGATEIPYTDIAEVKTQNTLGFVPNGMLVITKDGKKYKFVINNRGKIIDYIHQRIGNV